MKKFLLLLMLIGLYFYGTSSDVYGREYEITEYHITVEIKEDGSVDITEDITYYFDGAFNGVTRDVDLNRTGGLREAKVSLITNNGPKEYILTGLEKTGTYQLASKDGMALFRVYESSEDENKTFRYEYTFDDVIQVYEDVAIFNRKIVDSGWDVILQNIQIDILLPAGAAKDDIHAFGHGPLIGTVTIINQQHIQYQLSYMEAGDNIETLVLFPPNLIPYANEIIPKKMKSIMLEREKEFAQEANQARLEVQAEELKIAELRSLGGKLAVGIFLIWVVFMITIYRKYSMKPKVDGNMNDLERLPGDYTPAEVSYLLNKGSIGRKDITATLMDLIGKKQLLFQIKQEGRKENFIIQINPNAPSIKLKEHEKYLIQWFIDIIGDGYQVNLNELKQYSKELDFAEEFSKSYLKWTKLVNKESKKNRFFQEKIPERFIFGIISILYSILSFVLLVITDHWFFMVLIVLGIISFIYICCIKKLTPHGEEQYIQWMRIKYYLKNSKNINNFEQMSPDYWEKYLPYGLAFGVSMNFMNQIPKPIKSSYHSYDNTFDYPWYSYCAMGYEMDQVTTSLDRTISQALSVANSTISSNSGGDGGFSGGSSDGGGGSGGGGAF